MCLVPAVDDWLGTQGLHCGYIWPGQDRPRCGAATPGIQRQQVYLHRPQPKERRRDGFFLVNVT